MRYGGLTANEKARLSVLFRRIVSPVEVALQSEKFNKSRDNHETRRI